MLPEMLARRLADPDAPEVWLTRRLDGRAVGSCYAAPETLTDGTWIMPAIAVAPERQGQGVDGARVGALKGVLRAGGRRVLIADTAGAPGFARTRAFHRRRGYVEEARIRDFWAPDDNEVVFWKALSGAPQ